MLRRAGVALGTVGAAAAAWVAAQPSREPELGKACFDRHVAAAGRMVVNGNEEAHKRVARTRDLIVAVEPSLARWTFAVVQSESSQVVSLPGGHAIINSGAFDLLDAPGLDLLVAREMALAEGSRGLAARALALAHALAPGSEVVLDVAAGLAPSSSQLLTAERRALSLMARSCFDPTEVTPRVGTLTRVCGGDPADAAQRAEQLGADCLLYTSPSPRD